MSTYIERDVRQLLNVGNLLTFQRFVAMCAARSGQLLNLNSLAADCGISQPTARQWLTVLQASHLVTLLAPYHRNFGKRLVKTPKLYFLDTGLLCWLLRIGTPEDLQIHPARGAVFETWVVSETLKHRHNLGLPPELYFWRDNHGLEVDLVFEHAGRLHSVEIKSGTTYGSDWMVPARRWRQAAGSNAAPTLLVYGGDASHEMADHHVMGWRDLGRQHDQQRRSPWHRLDLFLARLRPHREPLSLLADALVIAACWNITYLFRLGFDRWISARPSYDGWVLLGVIAIYLLAFKVFRVPQSMWRFSGFGEVKRLTLACVIAGVVSAAVIIGFGLTKVPRAVLALHPVVTLMGVCVVRIAYRMLYEHARARITGGRGEIRRAIVMGAGEAARLLLAGIHEQGWVVLGLLDDDPAKQHARIGGVPVLGTLEQVATGQCAARPRTSLWHCRRPARRSAGARWSWLRPRAYQWSRCPRWKNCAPERAASSACATLSPRTCWAASRCNSTRPASARCCAADGAHHWRWRQHRQRAVPPGGALRAGAVGAVRAERVQPVHDRAGAVRTLAAAAAGRLIGDVKDLEHCVSLREVAARGGVPCRGLQACAADGS